MLEAQEAHFGAPLNNHLLYGHSESVFKGVRGMWAALDGAGLLGAGLSALVNRRVAAHFSTEGIVVLTGLIAWENASARFNRALGVESQGLWKR